MSKGQKEMVPVITKNLNVGDKFKLPDNRFEVYEVIKIKDNYIIYKNINSNEEFSMVRGMNQKVNLVDESADYQKKRFKEPYYMYEDKLTEGFMVKEKSGNTYIGRFDSKDKAEKAVKDLAKKYGKSEGNWLVEPDDKYMAAATAKGASSWGPIPMNTLVESDKPIKEGFLITGPSIEGKTFYVRSKDGQGTTFDRSNAFIFNSENEAKDTLDQMKKAGYYVDKAKVVKESLSSKTHKFKPEELKVGKKVIDKVGGHEVHGKITVNHHDLYKDNPYTQDKKGSTVVTITTDKGRSYDVDANDNGGEFILEGRIAKGYENLDADEKARHLLSHPSSKYMNDLKSENITERAIRKAVKEMLGKPDKRDPQFIIDVNEEGEAPAITNTTAEVANPDLPLKLKESQDEDYVVKQVCLYAKPDVMKSKGVTAEILATAIGDYIATAPASSDIFNVNFFAKVLDKVLASGKVNPNKFILQKVKSNCSKLFEDEEELENSIKHQTSVAGGMGIDAENAPSAKEHDSEVVLVKEHRSFRKFIKESLEDNKAAKKALVKPITESVGQKLNISLVRKAQNLKEVEKAIRKGEADRVKAVVDKSYKLSADEYDKFVYNFMVHTTYLSGEGGVDSDGTVHVVEITAPGKKTIYVDPEGYDYARYVGF